MKKLLFVFLASLVLFSCQKKDENANLPQDVVFSIDKIDPGNLLKSTVPPICPTDGQGNLLIPTYAMITITDGTTNPPVVYEPEVFTLDGLLYTQVIKLPPGTYTVTDFLLYDEYDVLIMATPSDVGTYKEYVTKTVNFTFDVNAFEKTEIDVEVLCYLPEYHDYFGFFWFNITEIVLREFCFFGDICLNGDPFTPEDYEGLLYGSGLGIDVPAIMKIVVKNNGVEVSNSPFNNETTSLTGPLCVQYPDKLNVDNEVFTFELWIWTRLCDGTFGYELFDTFTSTDDGELDVSDGGDGVLDFVVGTCSYSATDVTYGHFEWLVLKDLWDETNPNGFMFTSDPSAVAIWKWTRTSIIASSNITDPMSVFLTLAGYEDLGLLGYTAILNDLTAGNRFWSTSPSGLMGGFNATANPAFMNMANSIFPAWAIKYHYTGAGAPRNSPPPGYYLFGYDCQNTLRSAKMAADNSVVGAAAFLTDMSNWYLSQYVAMASAPDPQGSYDRLFINAIAAELGIGTFQGTVVFVPWDGTTGEHGLQEAAYGLMGGSWTNPDVVKAYIIENMCTATYSEPLAEAIYALGL